MVSDALDFLKEKVSSFLMCRLRSWHTTIFDSPMPMCGSSSWNSIQVTELSSSWLLFMMAMLSLCKLRYYHKQISFGPSRRLVKLDAFCSNCFGSKTSLNIYQYRRQTLIHDLIPVQDNASLFASELHCTATLLPSKIPERLNRRLEDVPQLTAKEKHHRKRFNLLHFHHLSLDLHLRLKSTGNASLLLYEGTGYTITKLWNACKNCLKFNCQRFPLSK
ncbi:hypothetical protein JTE90_028488 [Oedothorax gibbosus]|uniref:Uncharacterized protein n=1 Tax=Oedothorax gibbosus TaxID=931172 RepID=A0AAV6VX40_9ARAC|nr:hypothetical protein JTE90_028488 [Oedothorax gibbosus]